MSKMEELLKTLMEYTINEKLDNINDMHLIEAYYYADLFDFSKIEFDNKEDLFNHIELWLEEITLDKIIKLLKWTTNYLEENGDDMVEDLILSMEEENLKDLLKNKRRNEK